MAPPGMPKTTSTPRASSDRTSAPAPVVVTGAGPTTGVGVAGGAAGWVGGWARCARISGVGMFIDAFFWRSEEDWSGGKKKALAPDGTGLAHTLRISKSVRLGKYSARRHADHFARSHALSQA